MEERKEFQILVVDDDVPILDFFKRLFGKINSLSVALDGIEAIKLAKERKFNLIFIDVRLPGPSGVDVLQEIKKLNPDAIVIVMSGYSVQEEVRRAMQLGAQEFLPKPFDDIEKIMTIEEVAEYLHLHNLTVYRLAQTGKIPAFKVGGSWRIKKEVLKKWIDQEGRRDKDAT